MNSLERVEELLALMLKKTLFVAISRVAAPASAIEPFVAEYLAYMNALEVDGLLWASGPFIEEGVLVGDGLTILSTNTIEGARRVMEEEPLIKRGLRSFELRKWELREGRIDISLRVSKSPFTLMPVVPTGASESIRSPIDSLTTCIVVRAGYGVLIRVVKGINLLRD
jgi:hypothetical protein